MTIEAYLERIAIAAEKIAGIQQEKRGPGRPRKNPEPPELEPAAPEVAPEVAPAPVAEAPVKAVAQPLQSYTADDVRTALIAYQKRSSPEKARKLLKDVGGVDTLRALDKDRYAAVIDAAAGAE